MGAAPDRHDEVELDLLLGEIAHGLDAGGDAR
jgi:hypothetical protein